MVIKRTRKRNVESTKCLFTSLPPWKLRTSVKTSRLPPHWQCYNKPLNLGLLFMFVIINKHWLLLKVFSALFSLSFFFQVYNSSLQNFINKLLQFLTLEATKILLICCLCIKKNNIKLAFSHKKEKCSKKSKLKLNFEIQKLLQELQKMERNLHSLYLQILLVIPTHNVVVT